MKFMEEHKTAAKVIQCYFICIWLGMLSETDSYFLAYALCAGAGILCMCSNRGKQKNVPQRVLLWIVFLAMIFSCAVLLANYPLWVPDENLVAEFREAEGVVKKISKGVNLGIFYMDVLFAFIGGWLVGANILSWLYSNLPLPCDKAERKHPAKCFFLTFASIAIIDLLYLLFVAYPGILTPDTIGVLNQGVTGEYNNTHPFYYTLLIGLIVRFGNVIFAEPNMAVALANAVQVLFMAICYASCLITLYQVGVKKVWLILFYAFYALAPYNITYSATMWKDIPFAGAALLLITALYRIMRDVGENKTVNYAMLMMGGVGFCLFRTNGWYAFMLLTLICLMFRKKLPRNVLIILSTITVLCWILIGPVLTALKVSSSDIVELMSIPLQQLARTVSQGKQLNEEEIKLLSKIFVLEEIEGIYSPWISDPIKEAVRDMGNVEYIQNNLQQYIKMYLEIGKKYPGVYLEAWIEQTRGYWNGGHPYWVYTYGVWENDLGLVWKDEPNMIRNLYAIAMRGMEESYFFQPLTYIGIQVWGLFTCMFLNIWKKRKEAILCVPALIILIGLWVGTPVF